MPQQQINIFLLKESVSSVDDAIRSAAASVKRLELVADLGPGALFIRSLTPHPPLWADLVCSATSGDVGPLSSAAPSALLILRVDDRWFAVTFGHGRTLLSPHVFDRQFGLRAALNLASPDSLRATDSSDWDQTPKHRRTSMTRRSSIQAFNLGDLELLRGVVGTPLDSQLGSQIAGRDAATLWCSLTVNELPAKCRALLAASMSQISADDYPTIGNLSVVTDPEEIDSLDSQFLSGMQGNALSVLGIAPPDVLNWEGIAGFRIPDRANRKAAPVLELTVDTLVGMKPPSDWTIEWLRGKRVISVDANGNDREHWPLYDCMLTEFDANGCRYALFGGAWLQIEASYVARVNNSIRQIPIHQTSRFVAARMSEHESDYNERVAGASNGQLLCLDRRTIRHGPGGSRIEVCDILDIRNQVLYHVKDKFRSAGLSHLFTQAAVSAELLREEASYRSKVRVRHPAAARLFPEAAPNPAEYTIVLGIISTRTASPIDQMPFLGRARLDNLKRGLDRLGFRRLEVMVIGRT